MNDNFDRNFFRMFGLAVFLGVAFWTSVIVIVVLVLMHFGIL